MSDAHAVGGCRLRPRAHDRGCRQRRIIPFDALTGYYAETGQEGAEVAETQLALLIDRRRHPVVHRVASQTRAAGRERRLGGTASRGWSGRGLGRSVPWAGSEGSTP